MINPENRLKNLVFRNETQVCTHPEPVRFRISDELWFLFMLDTNLSCFSFSGQIQIGPDFLQSSFSILEEQPMDMLLGLDMLKRHQVKYVDILRKYTHNRFNSVISVSQLTFHSLSFLFTRLNPC